MINTLYRVTSLLICALSMGISYSWAYQSVLLPLNNDSTAIDHQEIELALAKALKNSGHQTRSNLSALFCKKGCEPSSPELFETIIATYPDTELVLFYEFEQSSIRSVTAVDALSSNVLANVSLPISSSVTEVQRANDLAVLLVEALKQQQVFKRLTVELSRFSIDEMATVSSFLLSLSNSNQIKLIETRQLESLFSSYIPIIETTYALTTDIPSNHLLNEFRRYWDLQDIRVSTTFDRASGELVVTRIGVPYWPSLLSVLFAIIFCFLLLFWVTKRRTIHAQLSTLAKTKRADDWLHFYEMSNKPWMRLNHHWVNKASYWHQIRRESQQLEKQAKLFYDAGDVNTAKLFISKALNINASAPEANKLIHRIQQEEKSIASLNDNEQWIRNKIAKSMINFRNNNYYKALRQAYQAEARCGQQKALKKQLKAIKKLVNNILFQSALRVDRVQIKLTDAIDVLSIGCEDTVFIGRDDNWIPEQGVGVMQFLHKGLSRIGQHAKLVRSDSGLHISELGSTNGTFINNERLTASEPHLLQQNDLLLFAGKSTRQGLAQRLTEASHSDYYCFTFPSDKTKDGYIAEYTKVWSDYMLAANRTFVLATRSVYICFNNETKTLFVSQLELKDNVGIALFSITLTPFLAISPIASAQVRLNDEDVIGKTALQLPAEISYKSHKIQIAADEYSYMSEYTKSIIQAELNLKNVEN